ncbi:T9SS type B sorting domain-containing protein [Algibacter miyuki]|uniref:T9SS type B sorting domain-containing protein n=1 Tax=Algibacter miyuki TaxID=1306933 RepID=A0ABV5H416_9FLAO|nr:T9SS type B sorting domain-containing protein [Algibacter miyuki]MDN3665692.1 T9SS type B sorting domain-containing protein [Algibacter miyuki]
MFSKLYVVLFLGVLTALMPLAVCAQGEGSNWYFGYNAGVYFDGETVGALTDGKLATNEGCSGISNAEGEILFYTDGGKVWDKNHNIMPNGAGLKGDISSTQSAIVVPKPNSDTIYYIFTVAAGGSVVGLNYSEVDMTLNNGNGDVTANKNIPVIGPCSEKISAVQHANGVDFWVTTQLWNGASLASFKITKDGVDTTPVISVVGSYHGGSDFNSIGYMKFSPNGKRLALAKWSTNSFVDIFDFDKQTGVVSNAITLNGFFANTFFNGAYGIEFSPNSKLLYVTDLDQQKYTSKLYQFDLTMNNRADLISSHVVISSESKLISGLQLGPNGKIYISNTFSRNLSVVENPNVKGLGCNYVSRSVDLQFKTTIFGLPSFIQSYFVGKIDADNSCSNTNISLNLNTEEPIDSVLWDFGDGKTSTAISPEHAYTTAGKYLVKAVFKSGSCTYNVSKYLEIFESPEAQQAEDYVICNDDKADGIESFDLDTKTAEILGTQSGSDFDVDYFLTFDDAEDQLNVLPRTILNTSNYQTIYARITNVLNKNCFDISSFKLIIETERAEVVTNLILCDDASNDGKAFVDLSQFDSQVYTPSSLSLGNYAITYHLNYVDATSGLGVLNPSTFETSSNNQTIVARLENTDIGCFSTTPITIIIDKAVIANPPNDLFFCGDGAIDSKAFFDLGSQTDIILNGQTGKVTYHLSQYDADNGQASIAENFENQSNPQRIFVRAENTTNNTCFDTTSFYIKINRSPDIVMDTFWYVCPGETVELYVDSAHDEYLWNTGDTSHELIVDTPGDYTVTVFDIDPNNPSLKCEATKTVQVIGINELTDVGVEVSDWASNGNTVSVSVNGIAEDFKYSLDGNIFQTRPYFNNLEPGDYTLYILNENECIVYTEAIFIFNYPKYFTPNNDGYHDVWEIALPEAEPGIKINIFDRYGKLLIQLNPKSKGWNGTFNGHLLASSDYWFTLYRPSQNKTYQGHFSLKR